MHPILLETPPTLHTLLTQPHGMADVGLRTLGQPPQASCHAQTIVAVLAGFAQEKGYLARRIAEAMEAWNTCQPGMGRAWGRLLAAQDLPENTAGVARIATHLGLPFVQVLVPRADENVFGPGATVVLTLFGDDSFLVHKDGRIAVPEDWNEAALALEDQTLADIGADLRCGRAVLLAHHGVGAILDTPDTAFAADDGDDDGFDESVVAEATRLWHDHDDPPFEGHGREWSNLEESGVGQQLLTLFVAMAGPSSAISFAVTSAQYGNDAGINTDTLDSTDFPTDLFLDVAKATIDFERLTGGQWEYNDGAHDRQSGYSFDSTIATLDFGPDDWHQAGGHERLRTRAHLLEMARTDTRLEHLRGAILTTFSTLDKDIAA